MKETVRSLRAYFVIVGLLTVYLDGTSLMASSNVLTTAFSGVGLLLAVGFLYAGVALPTLLAKAPQRINVLLALTAASSIALVVVVMLRTPSIFAVVWQAVSLLVCGYLYVNVKRLAAEARALPLPTA
jgi:hypothetical protein